MESLETDVHFLRIPGRPAPKRHITVGDVLPAPSFFRAHLGPRTWSTFDVFALCWLTAIVTAGVLLLTIPR